MDSPQLPPTDPPPAAPTIPVSTLEPPSFGTTEPFKKWSDCFKALKKLPRALPESDRQAILGRITSSPQRQSIAFELLWLTRDAKSGPRFRWLEEPMIGLLGNGDEEPDLASKAVPSEAAAWVYREFREVQTLGDWKAFVASGRHLWILYVIFSSAPNKLILIETLTALAESIEHAHNAAPVGKSNKARIQTSDVKWIVRLLKARIPGKLELPKSFLECLFAVSSTADLAQDLRKESNALHRRAAEAATALASEEQARVAANERANKLEADLAASQKATEELRKELSEERLHSTRQGGFNSVAKKETVNHVLSVVRRGVVNRLQNIRGYADRPNPNREEILSLVGEIEKHLSKLEEVVGE